MKRINILFLSLVLVLVLMGCVGVRTRDRVMIIVPEGMPALAQTHLEHMHAEIGSNPYTIERVSGPANLVAAMSSNSHDVVIAPLTAGARLIEGGSAFQCAAVITWGNLFLISGEPLASLDDIQNRALIGFGAGAPAGIVLEVLLRSHEITPASLTYTTSFQAALVELVRDSEKVVLTAEPVLSAAMEQFETLYVLDLNALWEAENDYAIPQACVFVSNSLDPAWIDAYLEALSVSINIALTEPELIAKQAEALDYPFSRSRILDALPRSGIEMVLAMEARPAIEAFLSVVLEETDTVITTLPNHAFYYEPSS